MCSTYSSKRWQQVRQPGAWVSLILSNGNRNRNATKSPASLNAWRLVPNDTRVRQQRHRWCRMRRKPQVPSNRNHTNALATSQTLKRSRNAVDPDDSDRSLEDSWRFNDNCEHVCKFLNRWKRSALPITLVPSAIIDERKKQTKNGGTWRLPHQNIPDRHQWARGPASPIAYVGTNCIYDKFIVIGKIVIDSTSDSSFSDVWKRNLATQMEYFSIWSSAHLLISP